MRPILHACHRPLHPLSPIKIFAATPLTKMMRITLHDAYRYVKGNQPKDDLIYDCFGICNHMVCLSIIHLPSPMRPTTSLHT